MKKLNPIKRILLLFLAISLGSCEQKSQVPAIQPIHSFNEVDFSSIEPNTLVIFDVDETLIHPKDTYPINERTPQGEAFRKQLIQQHPEVKDWDALSSIMLQEAERPLIEPIIIQKVNELKSRNILVIACTGMNTGAYGLLPSLEKWRYEQLKSLGFQGDFENLILAVKDFKRHPGFYNGILSTDLQEKGPILGAFLDQIKFKPQKIVMFDDHLSYLESVQKECEKRGIDFQGYHYENSKSKPWDQALIQFQADYLIKHKKWLNDQEAKEMLRANFSRVPAND